MVLVFSQPRRTSGVLPWCLWQKFWATQMGGKSSNLSSVVISFSHLWVTVQAGKIKIPHSLPLFGDNMEYYFLTQLFTASSEEMLSWEQGVNPRRNQKPV